MPEAAVRRYFDNAATSFPKPPEVATAVSHYLERVGASAGRGAYREAIDAGRMLERCRAAVRRVFGGAPDDAVVFTLNGTDALNTALKSLLRAGDHVVATEVEHNSVLRPLHALRERAGVAFDLVRVDPQTTLVSPDAVRRALRPGTRLVILNHASNVTGALQPLEAVAGICQEAGVPLLVDAAQSAGHVPIDLSRAAIDLLACPGHKGLLGPSGTGVLVVRAGLDGRLASVREGGTGSASEQPVQPGWLPDKFESGSHNTVGLAGLEAGLQWLLGRGIDAQRAHERRLMERMIERLESIADLTWYGPRDPAQRVGVFSVRLQGWEPGDLSNVLEGEFGVLTRSGLHCAPLAHRAIGTFESGGTTRLSLGAFLTTEDVDYACAALREIAHAHA